MLLSLSTLFLAAVPAVSPQAGGLEAALATVDPEDISADLHFFASDEMSGRDTPSEELKTAARFLRARLEKLGFQPGGRDGSWFHEYPILLRRLDPDLSYVSLAKGDEEEVLTFGLDYFLASDRDLVDLEVEGELVYCGEGQKDDLKGLDLNGAWAVVEDSDLSANRRRRYVQGAGAAGLIVLTAPSTTAFELRYGRTTELALKGRPFFVRDGRKDTAKEVFPQLFVARGASERLRKLGGFGPQTAAGTRLGITGREERAGSGEVMVENVCAFWPGNDPKLKDEVMIVSAHYDHVGTNADGEVFNGADDNGSGSMGLLAVADALKAYGPMGRSVMLIWVSGEEKGLWGSYAWTKDPTLPEGTRAVLDLNIDMIGRNEPEKLLITPTRNHREYNGLTQMAEEFAPLEGFGTLGSADEYWQRSDHANFAQNLKIPVAFLFSDVHEDYHQISDTPDKIDYDKIHRVVRLVVRMLDALQNQELDLR